MANIIIRHHEGEKKRVMNEQKKEKVEKEDQQADGRRQDPEST